MLSIDFETRSEVDLKKEGAYRYATDESTAIYMMSWAFDDEPAQCWVMGESPFPERVERYVENGGIIAAWNCQFERLIWWYVLCNDVFNLYEPELEQFICTAARARAHGMPSKLGDAARALGAKIQKMDEGTRLIREYCAKNIYWDDIPEVDQKLMVSYCNLDVETERGLGGMLRELSDEEQYEFHVNEHINDLGVPLDMKFARRAAGMADHIRDEADRKVYDLTGGRVTTTRQRKSRDEWLLGDEGLLSPEHQAILEVGTQKDAVQKYSFDETHRNELLAEPDLPADVRAYLTYVEEGGGATLRKYNAMRDKSIKDRLHGALIFNGAGQTGRFSSKGLQMHNLSRQTVDDPETTITDALAGAPVDHDTLKKLVRSTIKSPKGLTWFDWSNIEGRVAPWLADNIDGERKIQLYVAGVDPYIYNASQTFGVNMAQVTKEQRQAGKLQELALQFCGGIGALKMMGINYGLKITDEMATLYRDKWRAANPWATALGDLMNNQAMQAILRPQQWRQAGRVQFIYDGGNWLWMQLPSERLLAYYQPRIQTVKAPWGDDIRALTCVWGSGKPKHGEPWPRRAMHRGLWLENATQATAADILREAVLRVDDSGLDIVLHVHDEIIIEGYHEERLAAAMLKPPHWTEGLPIVGEGGSGERYGK